MTRPPASGSGTVHVPSDGLNPGQDIDAAVGPSSAQLRAALGRFTTGITVVTCCDAQGGWVGLTVSSFNALSLQPPLVLWSLRHASSVLAAFMDSPGFAVNVLAAHQSSLSHEFAMPGDHRFQTGGWQMGAQGSPVLAACAAVFECTTVSHQAAGDHQLFIGQVLTCRHTELPPLLYHAGHYHRLGSRLRVGGSGDAAEDDVL